MQPESIHIDMTTIQTYGALIGHGQCLRGKALRVRQAGAPPLFVDKSSLLNHLQAEDPCSAGRLQDDRRVTGAAMRALAPYGDWQGCTMEELQNAFQCYRKALSTSDKEIDAEACIAALNSCALRRLPQLFRSELRPGDILFTRLSDDATPRWQRRIICGAQRSARLWSAAPPERDAHKTMHVSIYLGDGQIAEASLSSAGGAELRIVDFDHPYYNRDKHTYTVSRLEDNALSTRAAEIARSLCYGNHSTLSESSYRRYNLSAAVFSVFQSYASKPSERIHKVLQSLETYLVK
ncbi:MAG: hypothetical protein KDK78_04135 [Chlamydiia bacterium]|nr:hypothetical protein [Chlamydiia bacterium]